MHDAAATLKVRTTNWPDGFHVRRVRVLSDASLAVFCAIWECGVFPAQFARVAVPLIPKKSEVGLRPIGALPAIYRVALKRRRRYLDAFEASIHRRHCTAS